MKEGARIFPLSSMQYQDQTCISCQKKFQAEDDIVVCPDCGTPYHRACWKEHGRCINQTLHDSNMGWYETHQPAPAPQPQTAHGQASAPDLDASANAGQGFLFHGHMLYPDAPMLGLNPDEEFDGMTMGELCTFIGKNHVYYLPIFLAMKETGRKISFNLIGLLSPSIYFGSRKLWGPAVISILVKFLFSIPAILLYLTELPQFEYLIDLLNMEGGLFLSLIQFCNIGDIAFSVLAGVFANYIYYRVARKTIFKVREQHQNASIWERLRVLAQKGGVSGAGILAVCSVWFVMMLACSTAAMLWL